MLRSVPARASSPARRGTGLLLIVGLRVLASPGGEACWYNSTSMWAFGPVVSPQDGHDGCELLTVCVRWLDRRPEELTDSELEVAWSRFLAWWHDLSPDQRVLAVEAAESRRTWAWTEARERDFASEPDDDAPPPADDPPCRCEEH